MCEAYLLQVVGEMGGAEARGQINSSFWTSGSIRSPSRAVSIPSPAQLDEINKNCSHQAAPKRTRVSLLHTSASPFPPWLLSLIGHSAGQEKNGGGQKHQVAQ